LEVESANAKLKKYGSSGSDQIQAGGETILQILEKREKREGSAMRHYISY
jgi:hypothetical protein